MNHRFQCRCSAVHGEVGRPEQAVRAICYCRDCQAYAHVLGEAKRVLDPLGGTDIVATHSRNVRFTSSTAALACLSLSPNGLLRWYASCCNTPIANTGRDWKLPYVGLVHTCLHVPDALERSFPKVQLRINAQGAHGTPPAGGKLAGTAAFGSLVLRLLGSRLRGGYRQTPFFDGNGAPVAPATVPPRAAVEQARRAAA